MRALLTKWREDQQRRGHSPASIRRRSDDLRSYFRSLPCDPFEATSVHVEAWLATRGQAARTRYNLISALASFYRWAIRQNLTTSDPTERVPRPRLRRYLPRPITDGDLSFAIQTAPPQMRAWLCLMAYGGLRCQEVAGVDAGDLLWHLNPPMLVISHPKGGRERTVPLARETEEALRAHGLPRHGPVFRTNTGRPFTPARVSVKTNAFLADMGIDATAHQLRHWFGSRVYVETLDLRATQELLGHASPTTTAIYTAFAPGTAGEVVRGLRVSPDHPVFHVPTPPAPSQGPV